MKKAGIFLVIVGAIATLYGIMLNNDGESVAKSFIKSGNFKPGEGPIYLGIIAVIIGAVLIIVERNKENNRNYYQNHNDTHLKGYSSDKEYLEEKDINMLKNGGWRCPQCNRVNASYIGTCGCGQSKV